MDRWTLERLKWFASSNWNNRDKDPSFLTFPGQCSFRKGRAYEKVRPARLLPLSPLHPLFQHLYFILLLLILPTSDSCRCFFYFSSISLSQFPSHSRGSRPQASTKQHMNLPNCSKEIQKHNQPHPPICALAGPGNSTHWSLSLLSPL